MEWQTILCQIEDRVFPQLSLNAWERALYYHLLRRTHVVAKSTDLVALLPLGQALSMGESTVRRSIRTLDDKKCIKIEERTKKGHLVRVFLPEQIEGLRLHETEKEAAVDMENIDFYTDRRYIAALLKREGGRCFYTLREVTASSCSLDHVIPQVDGGDNSYRNVVVASHEVNSLKQGKTAEEFLRQLYRKGILSSAELEDRLIALESLKKGALKPEI